MGGFRKGVPKFDELGKGLKIPKVPDNLKKSLWRTVMVRNNIQVPQETEHFLSMLCLHFGLSKNKVITHAVNLLWNEVCDTVSKERLQMYEEKLEAVRLFRLEQKEHMTEEQKRRYADAVALAQKIEKKVSIRANQLGKLWKYNQRKHKPYDRVRKGAKNGSGDAEE